MCHNKTHDGIRRTNGFGSPLHAFQVLTWFVYAWIVIQFTIMIAPFIHEDHPALIIVIFVSLNDYPSPLFFFAPFFFFFFLSY